MAWVLLALAFAAVYVAALLSACVACWLMMRRVARRLQADGTLKELHEAIVSARTWNSRLLATIRWAGQQPGVAGAPTSPPARPSGPAQTVAAISQAVGVPVPPDIAKAAAAGGMQEVEVPDALVNIAAGAGVDIGKVLAGDDAEVSKAKTLLNALAARTGGNGSMAPADGAPSLGGRASWMAPEEDYL